MNTADLAVDRALSTRVALAVAVDHSVVTKGICVAAEFAEARVPRLPTRRYRIDFIASIFGFERFISPGNCFE